MAIWPLGEELRKIVRPVRPDRALKGSDTCTHGQLGQTFLD